MRTIKTYSKRVPFYNALIRTVQGSVVRNHSLLRLTVKLWARQGAMRLNIPSLTTSV